MLELVVVENKGVLGDEDAFIETKNHNYMNSCECMTLTGDVYELRQDDFIREFKKQVNWGDIVTAIQAKRDKFRLRILQKNDVQRKVDQNRLRTKEKEPEEAQAAAEQGVDKNLDLVQPISSLDHSMEKTSD